MPPGLAPKKLQPKSEAAAHSRSAHGQNPRTHSIPIRNGDSTAFLPQDEVYWLLNDGLRARRGADAIVSAPEPAADLVKARDGSQLAGALKNFRRSEPRPGQGWISASGESLPWY